MLLGRFFSSVTSQIFCNEYTFIIQKKPTAFKTVNRGQEPLEVLCSVPWQPTVWETVPPFFPQLWVLLPFPSLSSTHSSVSRGVTWPRGGVKPLVHSRAIPGPAWLLIFFPLPPPFPSLLAFQRPLWISLVQSSGLAKQTRASWG